MSVERTIYCDAPGDGLDERCPRHVRTATPPPYVPVSFVETREQLPGGEQEVHHFCTWDCAMKFAAAKPPTEVIPGASDPEGER